MIASSARGCLLIPALLFVLMASGGCRPAAESCGEEGESCCFGGVCNGAGLTCPAGTCVVGCSTGACYDGGGYGYDGAGYDSGPQFGCGARGMECCSDSTCNSGLACYAAGTSGSFCASEQFQPCVTDTDCNGAGSFPLCDRTFPGGICTLDCSMDSDCTSAAICESGTCHPICTSGGLECDQYGGACAQEPTNATRRYCVPACVPAGRPAIDMRSMCSACTCNPYDGSCCAMAPVGGGNTGAPCTSATDCMSGLCFTDVDATGAPTGFVGGYCYSVGYVLNPASIPVGGMIPPGSCPDGSAVNPDSTARTGDAAPCFMLCAPGSACRPGYACLQPTAGSAPYASGLCLPENCQASGAATCPTGSMCVTAGTDGGVPVGRCETPDGGVFDAGAFDSG